MEVKDSYEIGKKLKWFFDYEKDGKIESHIDNSSKDTSMREKYCSYKPAFAYQYFTITDNSFSVLSDSVCGFMEKAKELIDFKEGIQLSEFLSRIKEKTTTVS